MNWSNQKIVLAVGAAVALIAGVILAVLFMGRNPKPAEAPPASQGGLQISVNATPPADTTKKLRCFVDGNPVGDFTLAECAQKNGVAAQALDVGLDDNGNLAAAPTASLAPPPALPPAVVAPAAQTRPNPAASPVEQPRPQARDDQGPAPASGAHVACLRFTGGEWRQVSDTLSMRDCAQALFAGRCVHPGEAEYGRYGETTLRLIPSGVEQSNDNRNFHPLSDHRRGCDNH
jgi:hypothetical protein